MAMNRELRMFLLLLLSATVASQSISFWTGETATNIARMKTDDYNPYREFNEFINDLVFSNVPGLGSVPKFVSSCSFLTSDQQYYFASYLRDLFAATVLYWLTAGGWHLIIYKLFRKELFDDKGRPLPSWSIIFHQMWLAQRSLFVYALLPITSEVVIENKLTRAYFYVDEIGGYVNAVICAVLYLSLVEIGIYWMHRTLHTNKWLYNNIHGPHHYYNKKDMLTPWASIAFHPIDGMLQASPYVACLFIMPIHYYTHVVMLFVTSVWATNIHDCMWGDSEPIMGSKYHTVHHTHYVYNYGQFFTFCDAFWGTLRKPTRTKSD
eukprot:GSChrysophyteH1.ASY1.ANO1.333.1 assembled CDS